MKQRLITSVILIGFLITIGIINNVYLTNLVISIISILAMYESKNLFFLKTEKIFYFLSFMSILAIFINPILIGIIGVIAVASYIAFYKEDINLISIALYPFLPLMFLEELYLQLNIKGIFWLIVIIALTDSMAYLIGKNLGHKFIQKKFSPTSPNKTYEGVIGGILSGSIIGAFFGLIFVDFFTSLFISFFVSFVSVFGDLFESYLKRKAGVKDSGNILPGHGGILDRIDGYLFGAPLMWAMIFAIGNI